MYRARRRGPRGGQLGLPLGRRKPKLADMAWAKSGPMQMTASRQVDSQL